MNAENVFQLPAVAEDKLPTPVLGQAGVSALADGTFLIADGFTFRNSIERAMRRPGAKDALLSALRDAWSEPDALRAALQPTRSAASATSAAGDAIVRLLLQCSSVQTELAQQLLEGLADHQEELERACTGMPLAKLVLSQFRWLEHVVDGSALLATIGEMLQVAEPPLRRELVQVLPDLVVDGQHTEAVQVRATPPPLAIASSLASGVCPLTPLPQPSVFSTLAHAHLCPFARSSSPACCARTRSSPHRSSSRSPPFTSIRRWRRYGTLAPSRSLPPPLRQTERQCARSQQDRVSSSLAARAHPSPATRSPPLLVAPLSVLQEMCDLVTSTVSSSRTSDLPSILRFLLEHLTAESAPKVISALRTALSLEFLTEAGGKGGGDVADQALVLDALLSSLRLRAGLGSLLIGHLEAVKRAADHKPIDWWLLTALTTASDAKSRARTSKLLSDRGAKAMFKPALVRAAICGHGVALRPHFAVQLSLAAGLVRNTTSANARALGGEVYQALFAEYSEPYERQEIICAMLTHAGSGAASEVDAALRVLVELASRDPAGVAQFSSFLTGVLDYLDGLSVSQARLAFELFARIAYDAHSGASRLADELQITIRKQLTSTAPRYKSLGVLGGCCLLGRLGARVATAAPPLAGETCIPETEAVEETEAETVGGETEAPARMEDAKREEAEALLVLMLKYASAPDGSFGFLLHELSLLVAARSPPSILGAPALPALEHDLISMLIERITSSFESEYLHDVEALPISPNPVRGVLPKLALSLDDEPEIAVNVLPLLDAAQGPASQRHALCTLSATFQLLRVCEAAVSPDGQELAAVDAVLGCPLCTLALTPRAPRCAPATAPLCRWRSAGGVLPVAPFLARLLTLLPILHGRVPSCADLFDSDVFVDLESQPASFRETVCLALFYTVDWLRELVNAFCMQTSHDMRKKVRMRLHRWPCTYIGTRALTQGALGSHGNLPCRRICMFGMGTCSALSRVGTYNHVAGAGAAQAASLDGAHSGQLPRKDAHLPSARGHLR